MSFMCSACGTWFPHSDMLQDKVSKCPECGTGVLRDLRNYYNDGDHVLDKDDQDEAK